jgi:hypothetical protein
LLTFPEHLSSPPVFSGIRVTRSLALYVCFVERCLSFFFWPLCCLFFSDIRILITPLVSSNSSEKGSRFIHVIYIYLLILVSNTIFISHDVRVVLVVKLHVFTFLVLCCDVRYNFRVKRYSIRLSFLFLCSKVHVLFMLFVIIYLYCYSDSRNL